MMFCWKEYFQYLIFLLVILSILSHLGCCNVRKVQSYCRFVPDPIWCVYSTPYRPTLFSIRENDKYPSWTLSHESLRPSDGPDFRIICPFATKIKCFKRFERLEDVTCPTITEMRHKLYTVKVYYSWAITSSFCFNFCKITKINKMI